MSVKSNPAAVVNERERRLDSYTHAYTVRQVGVCRIDPTNVRSMSMEKMRPRLTGKNSSTASAAVRGGGAGNGHGTAGSGHGTVVVVMMRRVGAPGCKGGGGGNTGCGAAATGGAAAAAMGGALTADGSGNTDGCFNVGGDAIPANGLGTP